MTIAKMTRAQFDLAVSLAQRADVLSDPTFNNLAKDLGVTPGELFKDVGWIKTGNGSAWSKPSAAWTARRQEFEKLDPNGGLRTSNAMHELQAKGPDALKAFVKLEMADATFEGQMKALRNAVSTNDTATSERLAEGIASQIRIDW